MKDVDISFVNAVIDELGGVNHTAKLCEIKPASVCDWRKKGIPRARLMYLKLLCPRLKAWAQLPSPTPEAQS